QRRDQIVQGGQPYPLPARRGAPGASAACTGACGGARGAARVRRGARGVARGLIASAGGRSPDCDAHRPPACHGCPSPLAQRVFVDAIFVSRTIVNWLFQFRNLNEGMFQLHATEDIFFEALHAKRKRDARAPSYVRTDRIEKIRGCVGGVLPTPPGLISVTGSDQGDNHSHAAAISSRADVILTQNSSTDITQ